MIKSKLYRDVVTPPEDEIDLVYNRCNFAKPQCVDTLGVKTGHRLFPGDDTPRTFIDCNLTNCEPPPGSTLQHSNTTVSNTGVPRQVDVVVIDGVEYPTYEYVTTIYGRYNSQLDEYDYKDTPVEIVK